MPDLHQLIVGPVVTEKSSAAYQARKEYAFRVHLDATKPQIREAIEKLFNVTRHRRPHARGARQAAQLRTARRPPARPGRRRS